jgi:type I restriction enzyme S subunit
MPISRPVPPGAGIVTAYTNGDVTLRENRRTDGYHEAADLSGFQGVLAGDFVVHGLDILRGSVGVSDSSGAISAVCVVCAPRVALDPRFFAYAMRAQAFTGFPRVMARGIREGGADFRRWDTLGDLPLPVPSARSQRRIADHLEGETARIDAIVGARERQLELLIERRGEAIMALVYGDAGPRLRLSRVVDLLAGYSFKSDEFLHEPGSVRLLRGINIDAGNTRWDETVWASTATAMATASFALQAGDIVMGMDRPVISGGVRVARLAVEDLPALLVQRVARIRARAGVSQDYLWRVLGTPALAAHFEPMFTGVSVPHVSPSQILSFEIPVPDATRQVQLASEVEGIDRGTASLASAIRRQIDLLRERRQALITAAVTGQIEIPGVAA